MGLADEPIQVSDKEAVGESQGGKSLARVILDDFIQVIEIVEGLLFPGWLRSGGDVEVSLRWRGFVTLLGLCGGCLPVLDCLFLGGEFFRCESRGRHFNKLLLASLELHQLSHHLGSVFEVEPELVASCGHILDESVVDFRFDPRLNRVSLTEAKFEVVVDHKRLGESLASNCEVVDSHDRVVVGVESGRFLRNILDLSIFNGDKLVRKQIVVH